MVCKGLGKTVGVNILTIFALNIPAIRNKKILGNPFKSPDPRIGSRGWVLAERVHTT
jgi:hypothetical protein